MSVGFYSRPEVHLEQIEDQTEQVTVLKNMGEILKAGCADYSAVVKTTIMLADLKDFKKVNEIYAKYIRQMPMPFPFPFTAYRTENFQLSLKTSNAVTCININFALMTFQFIFRLTVPFVDFPSPAPARSTCRVAALPLDAKIEFECIAALKA
ncbi:hypothetical protein Goklo_026141 [Gossypium klotzschianum]|uniref:YjgF-like protein n=1 Tax=Gossypium klotzschianum TaxID=34286 RepID=A0A7J8TTS1_9ROSI|nr:hypothetical protein [Gossypium klotzschianum]